MRVELQVETGRSAFNAAQQQMLYGVEADGAQPQGISHGVVDLLVGEVLHETQHPHELTLATLAHPVLQQTAQRPVLFGQVPPRQRRGLVQSARLTLQ